MKNSIFTLLLSLLFSGVSAQANAITATTLIRDLPVGTELIFGGEAINLPVNQNFMVMKNGAVTCYLSIHEVDNKRKVVTDALTIPNLSFYISNNRYDPKGYAILTIEGRNDEVEVDTYLSCDRVNGEEANLRHLSAALQSVGATLSIYLHEDEFAEK